MSNYEYEDDDEAEDDFEAMAVKLGGAISAKKISTGAMETLLAAIQEANTIPDDDEGEDDKEPEAAGAEAMSSKKDAAKMVTMQAQIAALTEDKTERDAASIRGLPRRRWRQRNRDEVRSRRCERYGRKEDGARASLLRNLARPERTRTHPPDRGTLHRSEPCSRRPVHRRPLVFPNAKRLHITPHSQPESEPWPIKL